MADDEPELVIKVCLSLSGCEKHELLHDMRAATPLAEHIAAIHANFGGAEILDTYVRDVAIFLPSHGRYVTHKDWMQGIAQERCWITEGCTIELTLAPHRRAGEMVLLLEECFASKDSLDADCFAVSSRELQMMLFESHCAEAFILQGGLEALLALAAVADEPSVQSNALEALRSVLAFPVGVERLLAIDGPPALVRLTFETENPRALLVSLELLCLLCSREHDGFRIVHGATLAVARERDEPSHAQLVHLVEVCPDLDVKTGALTLINQLVLSAGDLPSRTKLHALLERRLRLHEVLSSQLHVAHAPFRAQLEINA